mgnify:FL=1
MCFLYISHSRFTQIKTNETILLAQIFLILLYCLLNYINSYLTEFQSLKVYLHMIRKKHFIHKNVY